ncbi:hypothetical protein AVEN_216574-1 [Araneus ventricosus]|uniref:Uncharacterized protein n=1 Tax=Araneus ventricosus TaxID=182803 RepID=A0A4Y2FZU4_ARAVE|nr:hypothetical protein AVEN_216574-1 [Araneus ventricosus]
MNYSADCPHISATPVALREDLLSAERSASPLRFAVHLGEWSPFLVRMKPFQTSTNISGNRASVVSRPRGTLVGGTAVAVKKSFGKRGWIFA